MNWAEVDYWTFNRPVERLPGVFYRTKLSIEGN
jgi:hypothetical protein